MPWRHLHFVLLSSLLLIIQATVTSANLPEASFSNVLINVASMTWDKGSYVITHGPSLFEPTKSQNHTQRLFLETVCVLNSGPSFRLAWMARYIQGDSAARNRPMPEAQPISPEFCPVHPNVSLTVFITDNEKRIVIGEREKGKSTVEKG